MTPRLGAAISQTPHFERRIQTISRLKSRRPRRASLGRAEAFRGLRQRHVARTVRSAARQHLRQQEFNTYKVDTEEMLYSMEQLETSQVDMDEMLYRMYVKKGVKRRQVARHVQLPAVAMHSGHTSAQHRIGPPALAVAVAWRWGRLCRGGHWMLATPWTWAPTGAVNLMPLPSMTM